MSVVTGQFPNVQWSKIKYRPCLEECRKTIDIHGSSNMKWNEYFTSCNKKMIKILSSAHFILFTNHCDHGR